MDHGYGKRQTADSSWEFLKTEIKVKKTQSKTILMDEDNVKVIIFFGKSREQLKPSTAKWSLGH